MLGSLSRLWKFKPVPYFKEKALRKQRVFLFIIFENRVSLGSLPAQPSYDSLAHDSDCANKNCILHPLLTPSLSVSYSLLWSALCLPSPTPWLSLSALSSAGQASVWKYQGEAVGSISRSCSAMLVGEPAWGRALDLVSGQ